jgi:trans-aconitate methyltransferase
MSFYDEEKNISAYIEMAEGYDGKEFIPVLRKHLKDNAAVLELGMGPGKDVELLSKFFQVTGSDNSRLFLERFRKEHPDADLILLDAVTLETERKFDCIYSNKVLYHLSKAQLKESFQKQSALLSNGGILFHTFWYGDQEEIQSGLQMLYYTQETLSKLIADEFEEIAFQMYSEMEENDSFYIVLRKKQQ